MGIKTLARNLYRIATRSLENPSIGLNDPEAWNEMFGGGKTDSGVTITPEKCLTIAAVWQAVSMLSGDLARIPFLPYDISGDSDELDKKHIAYKVVHRKANRERAAFFVWRTFWVHALIWNKAYLWINRDGAGRPIELVNLLPDRTSIARRGGELYFSTEIDGVLVRLNPDEVFYVEGPTIDPMNPPELIKKARDSWGLALAAEKFESKFFSNGVRAGGYLIIPPHWTEKAAQKLEEGLRSKTGENNWFKTVVFRDGAKFEKAGFSAQEMEMIEVRTEQVREVARWFNLSPSKLGLSDSVSYNSKSESNRDYLDSTLSPWLSAQRAEGWDKLLTKPQQDSDSHEFQHDTTELLRMSPRERYQNHAIGIRTGFILINEARREEGKPPVAWGDERLQTPGAAKSGGAANGEGEGGADKTPKDPGATGDTSGGSESKGAKEILDSLNAYSAGVRSGAITPQAGDESFFRSAAGLPEMDPDVLAAWKAERTRRPVTLSNSKQIDGEVSTTDGTDEPGPGEDILSDPPEGDDEGTRSARIARNRTLYNLTARARKKSKSGAAFVEFIDGGLPEFRRDAAETGDESLVLEFHKRALELIATSTQPELAAGVETLCLEFERKNQ
jgi:HK97 family phage portal protein